MADLRAASIFDVKGMVFIVTGGGSGIGAMMAKALDANGARKVFVLGRRKELLEQVAAAAPNKSIVPLQCDVTSQSGIQAAVDTISSQVPFVNCLVANHGGQGPNANKLNPNASLTEFQQYWWSAPMEDFTEAFAANVSSVFYLAIGFMQLLAAGNTHAESPAPALGVKSQVICTTSISGMSRRPAMGYAYSASKAAVQHMMKQMATMFVPYGIRANVFAPGIYPSDMSAAFLSKFEGKELPSDIVPVQRVGTEEDIAGLMLFLCSKAGGYINGNILISDGGRLGMVPATY